MAFPLRHGNTLLGTLHVPAGTPERHVQRLRQRVVPPLSSLLQAALTNADNRAQLIASRARIAAAADEARQRIERDLHDGAQQHLIAIGLELRAAQAAGTGTAPEQMRSEIVHAVASLNEVIADLRELARGIHPSVLATGGLKPALRALARRSATPVEMHVDTDRRLSSTIETAAYYLVSESLTNAARHAHASVVQITVTTDADTLRLAIHDDGIGGADPARGSGLTGLRDRVETLGGRLTITSPPGAGTSLLATIPIARTDAAAAAPRSG
ncbi:sensor histidine kinase [Dactylosporangium sp. CA-052675]|uniref:sensor histidine kinase n=1 Tax=Dactylosporangium sp. CA-052675 TaxID=3239927 RepID=UPI003D8E6C17